MIEYTVRDASALDRIAPLWEQLKAHHTQRAAHFVEDMSAMSFEDRKRALLAKPQPCALRIDIAVDGQNGQDIAYCISSVDAHKRGELDSIYVDPDYRRRGIGETLTRRALAWMDAQGAESKVVTVAEGNERVFRFYAKFGFYPRATVLEQPKAPAKQS
jgi:ribosomal protein S18 acetylase RimI-like enzyme